MELTNRFQVKVAPDAAWTLLTDVERIAPCLPGAELEEVDGDVYRGSIKVKVGPISAHYRGEATFAELDPSMRRAKLRALGRETHGHGSASARISLALAPGDGATEVTVVADLDITGRMAQFGKGVLAEVSSKLVGQFAGAIEELLASSPSGGDAAGGAAGEGQPATPEPDRGATDGATDGASADLTSMVLPSLLKRAGPIALAIGAALFMVRRLRVRRRHLEIGQTPAERRA